MNFQTLLKYFLFLLLGTITMTSSSCREGCTDPDAENYDEKAKKSDGDCIYAWDKFLGSYNIVENCNTGTWDYSSSIVMSNSGQNIVIINNFGDFDVNVRATVTGNSININDTQGSYTFSGSGNINAGTLTIIYTVSNGWSDNCTLTAIQQ